MGQELRLQATLQPPCQRDHRECRDMDSAQCRVYLGRTCGSSSVGSTSAAAASSVAPCQHHGVMSGGWAGGWAGGQAGGQAGGWINGWMDGISSDMRTWGGLLH